jgi:peptidyl-prolyl cis-trans isomerase B (cyclophilin B)
VPSKSRQRQLSRQAAKRQAERRRLRRRRTIAISVVLFLVLALGGAVAAVVLTGGSSPAPGASPSATPVAAACGAVTPNASTVVGLFNNKYTKPPAISIDTKKKYLWTLQTSCGTIEVSLDPATAPKTVNSIVYLTQQGLYNGNSFHRIAQNFVIQGGDPAGNGTGGPGYTTVDKPPKNAKYPVGTVAMAKGTSDPAGTSGSQFFIVTSASAQQALAPNGVGQYAIVGRVIKGMDVVNKIAALPIVGGAADGAPTEKVYIDSATVTPA